MTVILNELKIFSLNFLLCRLIYLYIIYNVVYGDGNSLVADSACRS